jgi:aminoglycoside N3'-acetyltransferase
MDFEHAVGIFMEFQVTKERIIKDLRDIGINEGDYLAVALSFKSIGYIKGGPESARAK